MLPSWYCTFLSLHQTPSPPTSDLEVVICTHSFHTVQSSSCNADATFLVLHTFSTRTPDVTFLILQTLSSHHTPCLSKIDVLLYCRLSSHLARPSPHTADTTLLVRNTCRLLFTPPTLSSYCRCSPSDTVCSLLTLGNLLLVL